MVQVSDFMLCFASFCYFPALCPLLIYTPLILLPYFDLDMHRMAQMAEFSRICHVHAALPLKVQAYRYID